MLRSNGVTQPVTDATAPSASAASPYLSMSKGNRRVSLSPNSRGIGPGGGAEVFEPRHNGLRSSGDYRSRMRHRKLKGVRPKDRKGSSRDAGREVEQAGKACKPWPIKTLRTASRSMPLGRTSPSSPRSTPITESMCFACSRRDLADKKTVKHAHRGLRYSFESYTVT